MIVAIPWCRWENCDWIIP